MIMQRISRLRLLLKMFLLQGTGIETAVLVTAIAGAAATTGAAIYQAQKGGPKLPDVPEPPPEPAESPEPAPIQPVEFDASSTQRARKASARARTALPTDQTTLTSRLGATQSPLNVRKTTLG